jgi:hypothetical protein
LIASRITKKFKGNDDSNIQGAQRLQKDSSKVSPCNIQIAQQNLQSLEKEFLQELTAAAESDVVSSQSAQTLPGPTLSNDTPSPLSQHNAYDASRDRLLNMSLGLNSLLGSLLQRACTENQTIMHQQTAETMNALVGAFTSNQALSV